MMLHFKEKFSEYITLLKSISHKQGALPSKILSSIMIMNVLERIVQVPDENPLPPLEIAINNQIGFLHEVHMLVPELNIADDKINGSESAQDVVQIFEQAWTTYNDDVYEHSVGLVEKRLKLNGFDHQYFANKRCFDGGCGTGRLSLAIAKMGAKEVIAADIGNSSLEFFKRKIKAHNLKNITLVHQDITNLSNFATGEFDFVSSYGVLHHTPNPIGGLKEHLRITKEGGIMWLYLYGAGGIYWEMYDELRTVIREIDLYTIKNTLIQFGLREGLIYTYLDNVLAPRTYHLESEIKQLLAQEHPIELRQAIGSSAIDDPKKCINSTYGKEILGPEGEVRVIITKNNKSCALC